MNVDKIKRNIPFFFHMPQLPCRLGGLLAPFIRLMFYFNVLILLAMKETQTHNDRIAKLTFASVYPHYVTKVVNKNRTVEELHRVIEWLTGFDDKKLQELIDEKVTFETFFKRAKLNPNAHLITGLICGYRIEEIENPLTKQTRYLDKLVDELAKGRKMEKILRV